MTPPPLLPLSLAFPTAPPLMLPAVRNWPVSHHVFDAPSLWAVNAALATGRPLLLRGEPGAGKSQLARAAAHALGRPFLSRVVNARLEPEDLLFRFDAVARLAKAQILPRSEDTSARLAAELAAEFFLLPEVLWWALAPGSAAKQFAKAHAHCGESVCRYDEDSGHPLTPTSGVVVLIDEIDKAETEVPNSLLETLATGGFQLPFGGGWVDAGKGPPPLIIITTNEDRELPPAFLRRCLVHQMDLPEPVGERRDFLTRRVRAHPELQSLAESVLATAIDQLEADRSRMKSQELIPPGLAELLDLLRVVVTLGGDPTGQARALESTSHFAFRKHRPV